MKKLLALTLIVIFSMVLSTLNHPSVFAAGQNTVSGGFIDFEEGQDGQAIQSSIPGLQFTTTAGYDWVYGDWRTGSYNGPYPDGSYYSNGNFFAWLGPNQGAGRIDFIQGCATYLQVWVSSYAGLYMDGYDSAGNKIATAQVGANLDTGQMTRLRIDAPSGKCMAYAIIHDTGNYWLIDDLSTDAAGVPSQRPPVIVVPGLTGSRLDNNDTCLNTQQEVWPAVWDLISSRYDTHLDHLKLNTNGIDPLSNCDHIFVNRTATDSGNFENGAIRELLTMKFYGPLIDYLRGYGYQVFPWGYDWRKNLVDTAASLDSYINQVLSQTGASKVAIVDHSLGGVLTRFYVTSSDTRANKVEQVISLGTPFLGTPKTFKTLRWGDSGAFEWNWLAIGPTYPYQIRDLSQNMPVAYQILPSDRYWDVYNNASYYSVEGDVWTQDEIRSLVLSEHNSGLFLNAEAFHTGKMDDWTANPSSVPFRLIVGSGIKTVSRLNDQIITLWNGDKYVYPSLEYDDGDETVMLHSADLKGNGYDYSGGTPIFYSNQVNHGELITKDFIIEFVAAILATPPTSAPETASILPAELYPASDGLYLGAPDKLLKPHHTESLPPPPVEMGYSPYPVYGVEFSILGESQIHVYDQYANHTGPLEDGTVEFGIAGSTYTTNEIFTSVTLPSNEPYWVEIHSYGAAYVDLTVRDYQGLDINLVQRTITYSNIPIDSNGLASFSYTPNQGLPAPSLAVDQNRDGNIDQTIAPTSDADATQSQDNTPPNLQISLNGQQNGQGWFIGPVTVTITATDIESGINTLDYSVDLGGQLNQYTGPFVVTAGQVNLIVVQATDHAGNKASESVLISPFQNFLPVINR